MLSAHTPASLTGNLGAHALDELRRHLHEHTRGQHPPQHAAQPAEGVQQLLHALAAPAAAAAVALQGHQRDAGMGTACSPACLPASYVQPRSAPPTGQCQCWPNVLLA